jgi:hypothetical protein
MRYENFFVGRNPCRKVCVFARPTVLAQRGGFDISVLYGMRRPFPRDEHSHLQSLQPYLQELITGMMYAI